MKTGSLFMAWLCLLALLPACDKFRSAEQTASVLAGRLLSDEVVTSAADVKLLDATDHWHENSYLLEVPTENLNAKVLKNRGVWPLYSQNVNEPKEYQAFLKNVLPFSEQKLEAGAGRRVFFGFGQGCWYHVVVGDGEKAFVVRDNY